MRALVKAKAERGIWLQEIETPAVGPNDVLIEVLKTGICGTDVHIYNWNEWARKTIPVPMPVGHEFVGFVEEIGGGRVAVQVLVEPGQSPHMFEPTPRQYSRTSLGSGVLIDPRGYILTNDHVVDGADEVLLISAGNEIIKDLGSGNIGVHHGVAFFGLTQIIQCLPHIMHGAEQVSKIQDKEDKEEHE